MECWICLAGEDNSSDNGASNGSGGAAGSLDSSFCLCPSSVRPVHPRCLGRWQIQKAGTREETHCRFCNSAYQLDWRTSLSRPDITANSNTTSNSQGGAGAPNPAAVQPTQPGPSPRRLRPPTPIMAIIFEGQVHRIKVYPGPEGKARFQQQIRELVQLRDDEEFEVEFECKAPDSGAVLHLDGMDAFDAATHCASLTAAERLTRQKQSRNRSSSSSNGSTTTSEQPASDQQQEQDPEQQQRRTRRSLRHGASADVQLQVAAQHGSAAGSCPSRRGAANN